MFGGLGVLATGRMPVIGLAGRKGHCRDQAQQGQKREFLDESDFFHDDAFIGVGVTRQARIARIQESSRKIFEANLN